MQTQEGQTPILEGLTSYWTDRAPSYSAQNLAEMNDWRRDAWRDLILRYAPQGDALRILDVGTGPGFFAIALALAGHRVTALDVTENMLRYAQENAAAYGAEVRFLLHRGESLPFPDGSFDLIVSRNVTWNLEYPVQALREWKRVLAPGGRMVYFDANWYLYLFNEDMRVRRDAARSAFLKRHPNFTGSGDLGPDRARDLERIALSLPLSRERRPEWDLATLQELGMKVVHVIEDIEMSVTDPSEWDRDTATPMFLICAEKEVV